MHPRIVYVVPRLPLECETGDEEQRDDEGYSQHEWRLQAEYEGEDL